MSEDFILSQLGFCAKFSFMQTSVFAGDIFMSNLKELGNFDKAVDKTAELVGGVWSSTFKELIRKQMEELKDGM